MRTPQEVLEFWFSKEAKRHWFRSTPEFDADISSLFLQTAEMLAAGPFPNPVWEKDAGSALGLIILLDQFPRNMFRGSGQAFAWDAHSLGVAERVVEIGWDMELDNPDRRKFVYMPFMHAEDLIAQNRCVELASERLDDGGSTAQHAIAHRDVIEQFGRFPHRNDVLGRQSTREEIAFLANGGYNPS